MTGHDDHAFENANHDPTPLCGMTKREYFAANAWGILNYAITHASTEDLNKIGYYETAPIDKTLKAIADLQVRYADALIAELNKKETP